MLRKSTWISAFLFFIFGLMTPELLRANHLYGSDVQWKDLSNDTFQIKVTIYFDCNAELMNPNFIPTVQIISDSCSSSYSINNNYDYNIPTDVTPVCYSVKTTCGGTGYTLPFGIGKREFLYKVFLGGSLANCCWYRIQTQMPSTYLSVSTGNFSTSITNAWLNRCVPGNSPVFSYEPLFIKYTGQDVIYNHGLVDIDKDSISYELSNPNGQSYSNPWNKNYPLTCIGNNATSNNPDVSPIIGFNFDSIDGSYKFHPTTQQTTMLKITILEWRKINSVYKIVGKTYRESILTIIQSNGNGPPLINSVKRFEVCSGQQICFNINSSDPNAADTTTFTSDNSIAIPGSTLNITSGSQRLATAQFCWTTDSTNERTMPYYFHVFVKDNKCPIYGSKIYTYSITVIKPPTLQTQIKRVSCYQYDAIGKSSEAILNSVSKWEVYKNNSLKKSFANQDSIRYLFDSSGIYIFKFIFSNAGCLITHFDTINYTAPPLLQLNTLNDTTICKNANLVLSTNPINGQSPYSYQWFVNGSLVDTTQSITVSPNTTTKYIVLVSSSDSCKSYAMDSVLVLVDTSHLQLKRISDSSICKGNIFKLGPQIIEGKAPFHFFWYKNNQLISDSSILIDTPSVGTTYVLKAISSDNCNNLVYDTFDINFYPQTLVVKKLRDTTICANFPFKLEAQWSGGLAPFYFNWCPTGKTCSLQQSPIYTFDTSTQIILEIISSDICNSVFRDTFIVHVFPKNQLVITATSTIIIKGQTTILRAMNGNNFVWSGNDIVNNWGDSIEVKPSLSTQYHVTGINAHGCADSASLSISVDPVGVASNHLSKADFKIYSNPVGKELTIELLTGIEVKSISLVNAIGEEIPMNFSILDNNLKVNLEAVSSGCYLIVIRISNGLVWSQKIIKE